MGPLLLLVLLAEPDFAAVDAGPEVARLVAPSVFVDPMLEEDSFEGDEALAAEGVGDGGLLYSADVSDEELARRFVEDPASLGSISVGIAEAGRVINAVQLPPGSASWSVVDERNAWGTQETIDALKVAADEVHDAFPDAVLRVNHLSRPSGGWLRPHQSHQSGRDADLGFYYRQGAAVTARTREQAIDPARNWALLRSLIVNADVQFVLVDKRIQKVLYEHALAVGEKKAWLDQLFGGRDPLVKHARRHRDHFHVRFYAPRSQELGRRIQPVLAARADENLLIHRVVKGDSVGRLANRYNSTVKAIVSANGLKSVHALRVGRTLNIPVRGPCTQCPQPPALRVPPRLLPPEPDPSAAVETRRACRA